MEKLFDTIGQSEVKDLLATGECSPVAVSLEPDNGVIPYGAVIYRKSGVLYAPAAAAQMDGSYELLILADDADTTTNDAIAIAVKAYEKGVFKAGTLKIKNGAAYEGITAAQGLILRTQGITIRPFDDWSTSDVEADNLVALSVTVTAGDHGSASADKLTAKKGETVTLTVTPASGYVLDKITVTAGGVTVGADKKFVMGEEAVAISVTFKSA